MTRIVLLLLWTVSAPAVARAQLVVPAGYGTTSAATSAENTPAPVAAEAEAPNGLRLDISPLGFGVVERETRGAVTLAVALQAGGRLVFDGENGAFLDIGLSVSVGSGRGLFWSGDPSTLGFGYGGPSVDASGLAEGGYLHRFVLDGTGREGFAIDLGVGVVGAWIGAQISPGATALTTIDYRRGGFFVGLDVRGRAIAWFWAGGQAAPMGDIQALLRVGFGFGG